MTNHPIPAISNPEVTTTLRYSGDVIIAIRDLLTDVNLTPLYENWRPLINTQFLFRSGKLAFSDPDQTNEVVFIIDDIIDHDGNVNLHIPAFTDADDTILLENHPATFANKVIGANVQVSAGLPFNNTAITDAIIDASLNTLSNISQTSLLQITDKAKLPNPTVYTDQNNTFGSGYSQTFQSGYLKLYNPAATFTYNLVAAAISANRNVSLPLLTADDTLAFQGITNLFTTWQKIQYSASDALVIYKPSNTQFTATGIAFNLQTSTSAESTYAKIYGLINTNTNGSEDGAILFYTKKAGVLSERGLVNQFGQFGGTNSSGFRGLIDPVNMTSNKVFTLPNSAGNLLVDTASQIVSGKTMDWKTNTFKNMIPSPIAKLTGRWDGIKGSGLFDEMIMYGDSVSYQFTGGNLQTTKFATNAAANRSAGMRKGYVFCRRATNPSFRILVLSGAGKTNTRHYYGFTSYITQIPSGTTPLSSSDSGALIGFRETDTNYQIWTNDGGGTALITDTGIVVSNVERIFLMQFDNSIPSLKWFIYDVNETLLGSGTVINQLPASTTSLSMSFHVESTAAQSSNLYFNAGEIFT